MECLFISLYGLNWVSQDETLSNMHELGFILFYLFIFFLMGKNYFKIRSFLIHFLEFFATNSSIIVVVTGDRFYLVIVVNLLFIYVHIYKLHNKLNAINGQ